MGYTPQPQPDPPQHNVYKFRIKGHLDSQWSDWFEGLIITLQDNGETLLTGPVIDQAALHRLLKKIRDLGIPLISVCPSQSNDLGSTNSKMGEKK